jgi:alkylation response protein AidB-like acyl-CoA dehydrogenase
VTAVDDDRFVRSARRFLDLHLDRREDEGFVWGRGSDSVGAYAELDRSEEQAAVDAGRRWLRCRYDAGFGDITGPAAHGGRNLPARFARAYAALEREYDVPDLSCFTISLGMVAPAIEAHGSDDACARYLRSLRRGDVIGCQLFSEPEAGSDLASVRTRALECGGTWALHGEKVWTSGAHYSDIGEVLVRTDPESSRHAGLTVLVIDMHAPGVEIRPLRQMTGGSGFNQVFFDGAEIPDSNRLGDVGNGWTVAISTLMDERGMIGDGAARGAGIADRSLDLMRAMGLDNDPRARQLAADLVARQRMSSWTNARARATAPGGRPGPEASLEKLAGALDMRRLAAFVSYLLGARLVADSGEWGTFSWSQLVVGEPALHLAGGTDEVIRNIIAERVLGLPK